VPPGYGSYPFVKEKPEKIVVWKKIKIFVNFDFYE